MVQRVKQYQPRKCGDNGWARIFPWFRDFNLQLKQGMQENQTEKDK